MYLDFGHCCVFPLPLTSPMSIVAMKLHFFMLAKFICVPQVSSHSYFFLLLQAQWFRKEECIFQIVAKRKSRPRPVSGAECKNIAALRLRAKI